MKNTVVCGPFFEKVIGCSHKKFTDVRDRVVSERFHTTRRVKKSNNESRGRLALVFIKAYAVKYGNHQTTIKDTRDVTARDIHLPHGVRKDDVYISFKASMGEREANAKALQLSSFYELWRTRLPQIVCRKHQKFSQCTVCAQLKFRSQRGTPAESARGSAANFVQ